MKLKKTKSRTYKGKDYYRWTIQIPGEQVEQLRWQPGDQLQSAVDRGSLRVRKRAVSEREPTR